MRIGYKLIQIKAGKKSFPNLTKATFSNLNVTFYGKYGPLPLLYLIETQNRKVWL